ncbi:TonB-dependent receptor [Lutibacter sp. HS1-25]|uniref:SusC/RagA family TonB-linked outer membrane protein n=1 Tax=Lutibacter sp. HS1-25 TaxID=2485000 RepID=UPI001012F005|nr:TonB-dependent receptor [Lutibacter sp. HS1-25]RXP44314.1 TonB-dependent receptor [Lutibacter sp. HS1-25]
MMPNKMKSNRAYLLLFLLLIGTFGYAQERSISGKVVSGDDSLGLPGVNISIKGTSNGGSTDMDGNYTVNVKNKNAVLVFSYLGFVTKEVTVGTSNTINVTLQTDADELETVVVVGYGTVKKSDITGSVSSVKSDDLNAFPVLNAEQALQGRAAGVMVQSNNGGEPGAPIKVRVRGGTSINASSDALIVVDGFVGASMPAPEDIASMEILKDASSTAIYGSRAANGVILVTTKKGKTGKSTVELNTSYSSQTVNNTLDMLNADQFAAYRNSFAPGYVQGTANTDWQDEIYRNGGISNTQLSFSGGSDNIKYYVSGNFFDQKGVIINSDLNRFTILSNIDANISDKVSVGLSVAGGSFNKNGILTQTQSGGTGTADVVSSTYRFAPDLGIYNPDGSFVVNSIGDDIDNPYATATQNINETKTNNYRANFFFNWEIISGLDFKTAFGYSADNRQTGKFKPTTLIAGAGVGGEATILDVKSTSIITENYLTYKKDELWKGNLTAMAGYSYQKNTRNEVFAGARGFVTNSVSYRNLGGGSVYLQPQSSLEETELVSVFGRLNYTISDKYLFTFTGRYDGSSNFSKNHKYAFFPSGAFGWNMSKEDFLADSETISNWKWRVSYGATGNPSIPPYGTLARFSEIYSVIGDNITNAVAVTQLANDNLKWETSYQFNLGLDLGFFNNRLSATMDYYNIDTKDLLFQRPLPEYIGLANPFQMQNIGELQNRGFEFSVNGRIFANDNFSWSSSLNYSTNKTKILALPNNEDILIASAPGHFLQSESQILRVGESVGSFYGYIYEGVIQDGQTAPTGGETLPGGQLLADINGRDADGNLTGEPDGKLNSDDKTIIGDPTPDFILGFNNDFKFKNFDANLFFQASVGNDILNYSLLEMGSGDANTTTDMLNYWTPTNTNTDIPAPAIRAKLITSRYVYDGSYLRMKNISIGYSLPKEILDKTFIENIRVYVSGQNLITWTKYPGADPEANYRNDNNERSNTNLGLDYGSYPNVKTFTMGVNFKF